MSALPVATGPQVRAYARALVRRHRGRLAMALLLYALAAAAGLVAPRLLGGLVEDVAAGAGTAAVDRVALLLAVGVLAQTALTRASRLVSLVLAEEVFADLREDFLEQVVALPLSTVEQAGSGDLLTRMTGDVDVLARTVRDAVPEVLVASLTTALTLVAAFLAGPLVACAALVSAPPLWLVTRWYLRRAPAGYLAERATSSRVTGVVTESADAARTVDALQRAPERWDRTQSHLTANYAAERGTLRLRTVLFPVVDLCFVAPLVSVLLVGGALQARGLATLGQVVAVALYVQMLLDPLDRLLSWLDELQVGATSLARLIGVGQVPPDRVPSDAEPVDERLEVAGVRFAYLPGRDVLHGLDLAVRPGERLAVVGPSGAGKSTLGRLLAGVHGPRTGRVALGDVPLLDLPLERLRREVALVTQEHHVFSGTVAENVSLAREDASEAELRQALEVVDALPWVDALPDGLATTVGSGGLALSAGQAQQLALARLVLADPHTLVLDEATSLLDPRAARHLERSLGAVLAGRTVVAVAHRLHSASDADRVAVVDGGRVVELGPHHELMAAGGSYAQLWAAWQSETAGAARP